MTAFFCFSDGFFVCFRDGVVFFISPAEWRFQKKTKMVALFEKKKWRFFEKKKRWRFLVKMVAFFWNPFKIILNKNVTQSLCVKLMCEMYELCVLSWGEALVIHTWWYTAWVEQ